MKSIKLFFYRVDLVREIYFWISVPMMFACWFLPVGFNLFYLFPISLIGLLWKAFPLKIPSDTEIERTLSDFYAEHKTQLLRRGEGVKDENVIQLKGFSDFNEKLCRREGTRILFPEARSLLFVEKNGTLCIYGKDFLLADSKKTEFSFSCTEQEKAELQLNDNSDMTKIWLKKGNDEVVLYAKGRHFADEVIKHYKRYLTVG